MKLKNSTIILIITSWILFFVVCFLAFNHLGNRETNNEANDSTTTTQQAKKVTTTEKKKDNPVEENSAKIKRFIEKYYKAIQEGDLETLKPMVKDYDAFEPTYTRLRNYVDSYSNIKCYIVQGARPISFVVYVTYDLKVQGIDAKVPGLKSHYVVIKGDSYIIYNNEETHTTRRKNAIKRSLKDEKVKALIKKTNEAYDKALESNPELKEFFDDESNTSESTTDGDLNT